MVQAMTPPFDEVCRQELRGRVEERQQACLKGSTAVVVELGALVMKSAGLSHILTIKLPALLYFSSSWKIAQIIQTTSRPLPSVHHGSQSCRSSD